MQNRRREGNFQEERETWYRVVVASSFYVVWLDGRLWPHPPHDISNIPEASVLCSVMAGGGRGDDDDLGRKGEGLFYFQPIESVDFFGLVWFFSLIFPPPAPVAPSLPDWNLAPSSQLPAVFSVGRRCRYVGRVRRAGILSPPAGENNQPENLQVCFSEEMICSCSSAAPRTPTGHTSSLQGSHGGQRSPDFDLCCTPPPPLRQQSEREKELIHFFNTTFCFSFSFELFSGFVLNLFCVFWGFLY